jgi:hypothetical protein
LFFQALLHVSTSKDNFIYCISNGRKNKIHCYRICLLIFFIFSIFIKKYLFMIWLFHWRLDKRWNSKEGIAKYKLLKWVSTASLLLTDPLLSLSCI